LNLIFKGWRSRLGRDLTNLKVLDNQRTARARETCVRTYIFASNSVDHVIWGRSQKLRDDGELVDMVFSREQRLALEHLGEDAAGAPDIHLDVVLLPGKHNLGGAIVSSRDVARHLRILNARQTEVADLQIAVLVHQNVARLQISMDHPGRVDVLQTALDSCQLPAIITTSK